MNPLILMAVIFVVLLLMNMPVAFAIGIASISVFFTMPNMELMVASQKVVSMTQSFTFLAVPFFLLAGSIMNVSGITSRLVTFAKTLTGHMVGGLAQVSVALSALMGGISGSATVDAAMEARFLGPSMIKSGYSKGFTGVILSFGGLITATIPPSMGLIIYGSCGDVSIGKLFAAGIVPGIVLTVILMATTHIISKKRHYVAENSAPPALGDVWISFKDSFWALLFPVILIVGIRMGVFTTSEAGAFAVVYAVFVGKFIYKELSFKKLFDVIEVSIIDNGNCLAIVCFSSIFAYVSSVCGVPRQLAAAVGNVSNEKYVILAVILVFLFFAGMVMESTVNTLIFTPIFLPIVTSVGIDPVHFGILMMTIVTMGCMTPPVGSSMFVVCRILECSTTEYIKECLPYVLAIIAAVIILAMIPQLTLFLPELLY